MIYETNDQIPESIYEYVDSWFETNSNPNQTLKTMETNTNKAVLDLINEAKRQSAREMQNQISNEIFRMWNQYEKVLHSVESGRIHVQATGERFRQLDDKYWKLRGKERLLEVVGGKILMTAEKHLREKC